MTLKFITDYPVVFIPEEKTLVIAELHLGLEYEIYKSGVAIPPQREKFLEILEKIINLTKAKRLVIVGDIKHKVPGSSIREDREIPRFLEEINGKLKTILVKGNHDDRIEQIVPTGIKIHSSRGFKMKSYGFFHGHAWPSKNLMKCDYLFMGHIHPIIQFTDKFGYKITEPVWVKSFVDKEKIKKKYKIRTTGKLELIIIPTFNPLLGGAAVNIKRKTDELLGPLLKNDLANLSNAKLYLLDGTYIGSLKGSYLYF